MKIEFPSHFPHGLCRVQDIAIGDLAPHALRTSSNPPELPILPTAEHRSSGVSRSARFAAASSLARVGLPNPWQPDHEEHRGGVRVLRYDGGPRMRTGMVRRAVNRIAATEA